MRSARRRFRRGWGLAWGIAAVVIGAAAGEGSNTSATVHAGGGSLAQSEPVRLAILLLGCSLAAGVGVRVALKATQISASDRRWSAFMWAAIGAAVAAANWYLAGHHGPDWWYRSVSISRGELGLATQTQFRNPWMVHLALTLPIAGGAGGLVQYLATTTATGTRRVLDAITWTWLWAATFLLARYLGVIAVYLSLAMVGDVFELMNLRFSGGQMVSAFIGGYITGLVVGTLLSFSPGIAWVEPASPPTSVPQ